MVTLYIQSMWVCSIYIIWLFYIVLVINPCLIAEYCWHDLNMPCPGPLLLAASLMGSALRSSTNFRSKAYREKIKAHASTASALTLAAWKKAGKSIVNAMNIIEMMDKHMVNDDKCNWHVYRNVHWTSKGTKGENDELWLQYAC